MWVGGRGAGGGAVSGHRLGSSLGEACLVDINSHGCPEAATYASGAP